MNYLTYFRKFTAGDFPSRYPSYSTHGATVKLSHAVTVNRLSVTISVHTPTRRWPIPIVRFTPTGRATAERCLPLLTQYDVADQSTMAGSVIFKTLFFPVVLCFR